MLKDPRVDESDDENDLIPRKKPAPDAKPPRSKLHEVFMVVKEIMIYQSTP